MHPLLLSPGIHINLLFKIIKYLIWLINTKKNDSVQNDAYLELIGTVPGSAMTTIPTTSWCSSKTMFVTRGTRSKASFSFPSNSATTTSRLVHVNTALGEIILKILSWNNLIILKNCSLKIIFHSFWLFDLFQNCPSGSVRKLNFYQKSYAFGFICRSSASTDVDRIFLRYHWYLFHSFYTELLIVIRGRAHIT